MNGQATTPAPAPALNPGFRHAPGARDMVVLALMSAGFSTVDIITNNLVPLTCRHFTDNAFIIAAILATNRLFGFLVQPYVCWKSDYVRTRFGRRRPFFLVGLPLTLVSLLLVGLLPVLITGDARHTVTALAIVIAVNVLLQAVVDVNWGCLEPLYADTFRQEQLGRASSARQLASQLVAVAMMAWVLGWADRNEFYPYLFSAVGVGIALFFMIYLVREQPVGPPPPRARYNPLAHFALLARNSDYARLALVCAANLVLPATLYLFTPLYVTETLGLTKSELGRAQVLGPFLTVALVFPLGWLIDWAGPKWVMAAGFALHATAFAGLALWVHDFRSLFICMTIFGLAQIVALMPMTSMVFQYAGPDERGQVFSVVQFMRAFSAFAVTLALGSVVQHMDSHEPTPFREVDVKSVALTVQRLRQPHPDDKVGEYLSARLPAELRVQLSRDDAAVGAGIRPALVGHVNEVIAGEAIYTPERFRGVTLSAHTKKLLAAAPTSGDTLVVLNRSLLQDALPQELSRKIDYRLPYYVGLGLAVIAMAVAVTTRRGNFARTLAERPVTV